MKLVNLTASLACAALLAGCSADGGAGGAFGALSGEGRDGNDKTRDYGQSDGPKGKHLSNLVAGIWVDPNGCDHWIIDDGIEGYLSQRLDKYGKPVCSGIAPSNTAVGPYKGGQTVGDPI